MIVLIVIGTLAFLLLGFRLEAWEWSQMSEEERKIHMLTWHGFC